MPGTDGGWRVAPIMWPQVVQCDTASRVIRAALVSSAPTGHGPGLHNDYHQVRPCIARITLRRHVQEAAAASGVKAAVFALLRAAGSS